MDNLAEERDRETIQTIVEKQQMAQMEIHVVDVHEHVAVELITLEVVNDFLDHVVSYLPHNCGRDDDDD